ncbi:MAG: hypothetical protein LBT38_12310 [Deltaproteobacteria bacterium]|jgi:ankyrin repeat protein|nr:hypothetical protein [Deltaproteobacteria bacterium]
MKNALIAAELFNRLNTDPELTRNRQEYICRAALNRLAKFRSAGYSDTEYLLEVDEIVALSGKKDFDEAFELGLKGALPFDSALWELRDSDGDTVAHLVARSVSLPEGFYFWGMETTFEKWTVAHDAATAGTLPLDFSDWSLRDDDGDTVAHVAALNGNLPINYDAGAGVDPINGSWGWNWDWEDDSGFTVADCHRNYMSTRNYTELEASPEE